MKTLFFLCILWWLASGAIAQKTYLKQDFRNGGVISDYVDATNPGDSKFTGIGISSPGKDASTTSTVGIVSNSFETYRPRDAAGATISAGDPYLTYEANFSPEPTSLYIQFTIDGLPSSEPNTRANAALFSVGSGTDYRPNATVPDISQTFTRIYVNTINNTPSFQWALRWINNSKGAVSAYYTGQHAITWILNRAGGRLTYLKPPNSTPPSTTTLADGKWDLWVDGDQIFDEITAINASIPLVNFKYIHAAGTGYIRLDDIWLRDVSGALPLYITKFRASVNGSTVDLSWQAENVAVGSLLDVERSSDGLEYAIIQQVVSEINRTYYGHTDRAPLPGTSYYRLRQHSPDGTTTLSRPAAVNVIPNAPGLTIFDNPGNGLVIRLKAENLAEATYQLTTLTGQTLSCHTSETPGGQVTLQLQHPLPSGIYLLTATTGSVRLTRRVLVQ